MSLSWWHWIWYFSFFFFFFFLFDKETNCMKHPWSHSYTKANICYISWCASHHLFANEALARRNEAFSEKILCCCLGYNETFLKISLIRLFKCSWQFKTADCQFFSFSLRDFSPKYRLLSFFEGFQISKQWGFGWMEMLLNTCRELDLRRQSLVFLAAAFCLSIPTWLASGIRLWFWKTRTCQPEWDSYP